MTPADAKPGADDIGAPVLPTLCPDHWPVIKNAKHLEHVGDDDVMRAHLARARQCPDCRALNPRSKP